MERTTLRPRGFRGQLTLGRRAVAVLGLLSLLGGSALAARGPTERHPTRTYVAVADAFVNASAASSNFGTLETLRVDAAPRLNTYLRFSVTGVTGKIRRATLHVYSVRPVPTGLRARKVLGGAWNETALTWSNAPALGRRVHGVSGPLQAGKWELIDVTSLVRPDQPFTIGLTGPGRETAVLRSREWPGFAPKLVVETTSLNEPPVAVADEKSAVEDTELTFGVSDLLANDTDPDGDALTVSGVSAGDATHGRVSLDGGVVTYEPATNFNGRATFQYTIDDGAGGTATGLVGVTVAPVNDVPSAEDDSATVSEDVALRIESAALTGNDVDVDGDGLTVVGVSAGPGTHGAVALEGGVVVYRPDLDYFGPASFVYDVSDGHGGTASALVFVAVAPVNDPPHATADSVAATEDVTLVFASSTLVANDSDVDSTSLRVTAVAPTAATHGSVSLAAGSISYVPTSNYNGPASFEYTMDDGEGATATSTVDVTVAAVNDAPLARDDAVSGTEDVPLALGASLIANDEDVDGDALTVSAVAPGPDTHGTVTLADGVATYTPDANYFGSAEFGYTVTDSSGATAAATVSVSVASVNDAPVAGADSKSGTEDTALVFPAADLLVNDTDLEGDALSVAAVAATGATRGAVALADGVVTYTPAANVNGPVAFEYTLVDTHGAAAIGTVGVDVAGANDSPTPQTDSVVTDQEAALTFDAADLVTNDSDAEGNALVVSAVEATADTHGTVTLASGSITYVPAAGYSGPAAFVYTVSDGEGATANGVVQVTVTLIVPALETLPMPHSGDSADDPAIWVNPSDPAASTIIGTDKQGGLAVYDLSGNLLQFLDEGRVNNVDLRSGFPLGGESATIVVTGDRSTRKLKILKVDPSTRLLTPVDGRPTRSILSSFSPYGLCMYRSPSTGKFYVFVNSVGGSVEQWELMDDGTGQVAATRARTFAVGSQTEGCVADDQLGHFYIGEELIGIWKYGAEPGDGSTRVQVDSTGAAGHLTADVEGLTIAYGTGAGGYLLASSQGNNTYAVYRRDGDNRYLRSFRIRSSASVDAVTFTDGIDVTTANLGASFPQGLLVVQDDVNCLAAVESCAVGARGNQNFKLVPWQSLGLTLP